MNVQKKIQINAIVVFKNNAKNAKTVMEKGSWNVKLVKVEAV